MTKGCRVERQGGVVGDDTADRPAKERTFDLVERTAVFGESVIRFSRTVKRDAVTMPLISQVVRSATSVGANYVEADESGSKKEFKYRISVCRRETKETQHWLRMIVAAAPETKDGARGMWQEAAELIRIFETIHRKVSVPPR